MILTLIAAACQNCPSAMYITTKHHFIIAVWTFNLVHYEVRPHVHLFNWCHSQADQHSGTNIAFSQLQVTISNNNEQVSPSVPSFNILYKFQSHELDWPLYDGRVLQKGKSSSYRKSQDANTFLILVLNSITIILSMEK